MKKILLGIALCIASSLLQAETKARRYALAFGTNSYHADVYKKAKIPVVNNPQAKKRHCPLLQETQPSKSPAKFRLF